MVQGDAHAQDLVLTHPPLPRVGAFDGFMRHQATEAK
jgi:hypothetical protein